MSEGEIGPLAASTVKVAHETISISKETGTPFAKTLEPSSITPGVNQPESVFEKYRSMHRALVEKTSRNKVVWGGELPADLYGARDLKGTGAENTPAIRIVVFPGGSVSLETEGLVDHEEADEFALSREIREDLGLPTEKPTAVHQLKQVWLNGQLVAIDQWRQWALEDRSRVIDLFLQKQLKILPAFIKYPIYPLIKLEFFVRKHLQYMPMLKKYIKEVNFYALERELQTEERLCDVAFCNNEGDFKKVAGSAFGWVNSATSARHSGIIPHTEQPLPFDINNPQDVERYFGTWLPRQMGIYLAKMHNKDYLAVFPHAQNWSVAGTLYDLSSCFRRIAKNIKDKDKPKNFDVADTMVALMQTLHLGENNYLETHHPELIFQALPNFLRAYYQERNITPRIIDMKILFLIINSKKYGYPGISTSSYLVDKRWKNFLSKYEFAEKIARPLGVELTQDDLKLM